MKAKTETFAERLRRIRLERGLSQKEAALRIGVAATTYREWEYGRAIKGLPYPKIAELLGVSLKELLTGERTDRAQISALISSIEANLKRLREALESV